MLQSEYSEEEFNDDLCSDDFFVGDEDEVSGSRAIKSLGSGDNMVEDIVEEVEEDEENDDENNNTGDKDAFGRVTLKGRRSWFAANEYGAEYYLLNGKPIFRKPIVPMRRASGNASYTRALYKDDIPLDDLFVSKVKAEELRGGSKMAEDTDAWNVWTSELDLDNLTTLDVQRNVCAAINSRRRMEWSIGVEKNGLITGCALTRDKKDILRQAIDFALSKEFVPEVDRNIVALRFIPVRVAGGGAEDAEKFIVRISTTHLLNTMHQLSSGRIFYLHNDEVVAGKGLDQIRRALEERSRVGGSHGQNRMLSLGCSSPPSKDGFLPFWIAVSSFSLLAGLVVGRMLRV